MTDNPAAAGVEFYTFDLEDALALRQLNDGRWLGVFQEPSEIELTPIPTVLLVDGTRMAVNTLSPARRDGKALVLCINDDLTREWWRPLQTCGSREAAPKMVESYKEGDDDRRTEQTLRPPWFAERRQHSTAKEVDD